MASKTDVKPPLDFVETLRPLFDCLDDGICVADAEGRLLYANAAAGRLLGPAAKETLERPLCGPLCGALRGTYGETAQTCPLKVAGGGCNSVTFEGRYPPTMRDLRVRCLRATLPRGVWHFIVIEDRTTEAGQLRWLEEMRQMCAHDIRGPLTSAFAALRVLEEMGEGAVLGARDMELIKLGARNCGRISSLLDAYLETARLEEGVMPVHEAQVDVARLVRDCVREEEAVARERALRLTVAAPQSLIVAVDPELLHRAVVNLIANALKFTPAGGRVDVGAEERDGSVVIRVADNGPGISAQDLPRIFERFYQGTGIERRSGFGLGLAFCRAAMIAMGGDVSVESQEGKGSVFSLRLPRKPERSASAPRPSS